MVCETQKKDEANRQSLVKKVFFSRWRFRDNFVVVFTFCYFNSSLSHYRNRYQVATNSYNLSAICLPFSLTISHARALLNSIQ